MDLYFDCGSGISGDMTLAAFVDLGVPVDWLCEQIAALPLSGFDIEESNVFRHHVGAKKIDVRVTNDQEARDYAAIRFLIEKSSLPDRARKRALSMFEKLALAEATVHGCEPEQVHFHELGGVDALVDITGAALCTEYLDIKQVRASSLPLGSGQVKCAHGTLPLPAPATMAILKEVPVYGAGVNRELVTPTGAAVITTLAGSFGPQPAMNVEKCGYGAASRENENLPSVLRIMGGRFRECPDTESREQVMMVEAAVDDMSPEVFGYVMEKLFAKSALDVYWVPVFMKKNRPGTLIQVMARHHQVQALVDCLLCETTTTGVRYYTVNRCILPRRSVAVETEYGVVRAKRMTDVTGQPRLAPEYEACREAAERENVPLLRIYQAVTRGREKPVDD